MTVVPLLGIYMTCVILFLDHQYNYLTNHKAALTHPINIVSLGITLS